MSDREKEGAGRLGFLGALGQLFGADRERSAASPEAPQADSGFEQLEADFAAALQGLNERIEAQRRDVKRATPGVQAAAMSAEQRAADRKRRMEESHRAIGEDIEKMHDRLGTGLGRGALDEIVAFLVELERDAAGGKGSHELIPRASYAIAERLRAESGQLAIARLIELLERAGIEWPDPTHHRPTETPEEISRSRKRRMSDVRETFLAQKLTTTAVRVHGVVRGWGGDYPLRGSPLWEETVLEGVAAGIRGGSIKEFVLTLRSDRVQLLTRTEEAIGKEITALHGALESGACSAEQARRVVASSLRVLDEVVPEIAWEIVSARLRA